MIQSLGRFYDQRGGSSEEKEIPAVDYSCCSPRAHPARIQHWLCFCWGRKHHRRCFSQDLQRLPGCQPNGHLPVLTPLTLSCIGSMSYFFFLKPISPSFWLVTSTQSEAVSGLPLLIYYTPNLAELQRFQHLHTISVLITPPVWLPTWLWNCTCSMLHMSHWKSHLQVMWQKQFLMTNLPRSCSFTSPPSQ